jgi:nucleoid-associated protein YgaU
MPAFAVSIDSAANVIGAFRMGMFSFIKDVGEKLFGGGAKAATPAAPTSQEVAQALQNKVKDLGLDVSGLQIVVNGDQVQVQGAAPTQAEREKLILAIGNSEGVAQVSETIVVHQPAPEAKFYTVAKGDNLSKISKQFYGDANKYQKIFEANKPMLKHPDKIFPGQVLRIPD